MEEGRRREEEKGRGRGEVGRRRGGLTKAGGDRSEERKR